MHTRKLLLALSLVAITACGWYKFNQRAARVDAERAVADMASQRTKLEAQIHQAEQRVAAVTAEREQAEAALAAANQKKTAAVPMTASRAAAPVPSANAVREAMLRDPALQNLQLAVAESKLKATYQPFGERMKLSDEQSAQLLANLRHRGEQEMDLAAVAETQHLGPNDPALAKLKQQAADEFRAKQTALLGEAGMRQFDAYERTVAMREFVNELAGVMTISGAGLNAAQGDALTDIMANASASYRQGGMATVRTIDWDQTLASARSALSEPQFVLFKNGVLQLRNMDRLRTLAQQK